MGSFQNVIDERGIEIAVAGMVIVFSALVLISLFIAALPRILELLDPYLPAAGHGHAAPVAGAGREDELIAAAIGVALHHQSSVATQPHHQ